MDDFKPSNPSTVVSSAYRFLGCTLTPLLLETLRANLVGTSSVLTLLAGTEIIQTYSSTCNNNDNE